ncbi:MAG: pantetheine-phosphate adenylyltransferase [Deltaproteobacteria bacterium]|nr:pantetheine-phosphate adenylyltransferase [Deltaproteobacteria bacterium]
MRSAICSGTFDPPTDGHLNIVERGLKLFDRIIIAVATNTTKIPMFTPKERVDMLRLIFKNEPRVEVDTFNGLLVNYTKKRGVFTILRGIRNMSDYEYESQMALANKTLAPNIEILYMMTEGKYAHVSSSIIKEVITFGGSGYGMIHPIVEERLRKKLKVK